MAYKMDPRMLNICSLVFLSVIGALIVGQIVGYIYLKRKANGKLGKRVEKVVVVNIAVGILGVVLHALQFNALMDHSTDTIDSVLL